MLSQYKSRVCTDTLVVRHDGGVRKTNVPISRHGSYAVVEQGWRVGQGLR